MSALISLGRASSDTQAIRSIDGLWKKESWSLWERHPVSLTGVVTRVDEAGHRLVLQDETGAIAVTFDRLKPGVLVGQQVRLEADDSLPVSHDLPRYPNSPDNWEFLPDFESVPEGKKVFYIDRLHGYLMPPVSGMYSFAIASDDVSALMLSDSGDPKERKVIAQVGGFTRLRDWNRMPSQRSKAVFLEAGREYYIEAVHEQTGGDCHVSVAWTGPGIPMEVIAGKYLKPFSGAQRPVSDEKGHVENASQGVCREVWEGISSRSLEVLVTPRTFGAELFVSEPSLQVLDTTALPEPKILHPGDSLGDRDNFRWSELEGTVDFVSFDGERMVLELTDQGERVQAISLGGPTEALQNLRGRRVRVVGVAEAVRRQGTRQVVGKIWLKQTASITVLNGAPQPDLARLARISDFVYGDTEQLRNAAVKVTGRVVSRLGNQLTICDDGTFAAYTSADGKKWEQMGSAIEQGMPTKVYIGFAVNARVNSKKSRAQFSQVTGLSEHPLLTDLGEPPIEGKVTIKDGTFAIEGVGSDIWDIPDQFTFVYESIEGGGSIVARLDAFSPADQAARAGLMIRENLTPDGQFVDVVRSAESGQPTLNFQWRWKKEGYSARAVSIPSADPGAPIWLKLERRFNQIEVQATDGGDAGIGDTVDVTGYVSDASGKLSIVNALVDRRTDSHAGGIPDLDWIPLLQIAHLNEDKGPWGGLDFFKIRGVVTFCGDVMGQRYWAVQDETAATFLTARMPSRLFDLAAGSCVEVFSNPGWALPSPVFYADNVFRIGDANMPDPVRHPAEYLLPRRGEGTWIELEGVVRSVSDDGLMEVKTKGELFSVAMRGASAAWLRHKIDSTVRLRGVIAFPNERERLLLVPGTAWLEVVEPEPVDPFSLAADGTSKLTADYLLNQSRHRLKLAGTVTYIDHGFAYIQDSFGGVRIEFDDPASVSVGESVEAVGFPDWGEDNTAVIRHARLRQGKLGGSADPVAISPEEASNARYRSRLVRIQAYVTKNIATESGVELEVESGRGVLQVKLPGHRAEEWHIPEGSLVQITGVDVQEPGRLREENQLPAAVKVKLLLRASDDLIVLQKPPWWVIERTLLVVGLATVIVLIVIVWIHKLRERVKVRTEELAVAMEKLQKEVRMAATLAERDRLAGEIHDSLEQGLNGIIFQLESTASTESCPKEIRSGLELARNMASFSRAEVQHAVWELQSPMLRDTDLPSAVEKIMRQLIPPSIKGQVQRTGTPKPLPSVVEHHLLRVAQEAINNTVKHATASHLEVTLDYEADAVALSVTDDGSGFVPEQVQTGGVGHFGLRSLRSRVHKIHASLEIRSAPGKGTTIRVKVPLPVENNSSHD